MEHKDELRTFVQEEYSTKLDGNLRFLLEKYSIETMTQKIVQWLQEDSVSFYDITTFASDFYTGSDLTSQEKETYYKGLQDERFFQILESFLYSDSFTICSWTIHTIGRFSEPENSMLLEKVYETRYNETNFLLAYHCLNELSWLESERIESYLKELEQRNTTTAKLIQLYYWVSDSDDSNFNSMLQDKELINLIISSGTLSDNKDIVAERLLYFESYLTQRCNENNTISITDIDNIAKTYFQNM